MGSNFVVLIFGAFRVGFNWSIKEFAPVGAKSLKSSSDFGKSMSFIEGSDLW